MSPGESIKVLIVEDSPSQAAVISNIVKKLGYQVSVYLDVSQGIAQIMLKEQPGLVLLDLHLLGPDGKPAADGFQICREIKRFEGKNVPVIVVTAEADDDAVEWALLQGADAFIGKPFNPDELSEIISRVLGK